ncbi:hypothetical protein FRC01_000703 [Tulasnella sp. 417]|nr:hypothetical protein FRC01_000703 [Tulasnella sp. 417]
MIPNRMGLGMRPPMMGGGPPGYGPPGQGPPLSALSAQSHLPLPPQQQPQPTGPKLTAFVGSISPGITDAFLIQLLSTCGPLRSFKRTPTATGKPGAFGFAEFDEPDAISRALKLLNGLTLPSSDEREGPAKALKITADAKTKSLLDQYDAQKMETEADTNASNESREKIDALLNALKSGDALPGEDPDGKANGYQVPAHLKDLQEADLPENQRGIVLSEIAQFRERAMKKEKEKTERERLAATGSRDAGYGERRYEPRERQRIAAIERTMNRERVVSESEDRDRSAMKSSLEAWDDDESDELFYIDRTRWRAQRGKVLAAETAADANSRKIEEREAEHLRQESERFLARQMDDLRSLAEEQRKAGMLLVGEESGPLRLNMSMGVAAETSKDSSKETPSTAAPANAVPEKRVAPAVFGDVDDEEETLGRKRRKGLVKLDFGLADGAEAGKERLNKLKEGISRDKEILFKFKVRWEALNDNLIDTKFEQITKRKMKDYLGDLEDDDLIMFVVEHLKDHKPPQKLLEGLESVLMEEAEEFVVLLWRQVVFESVAYAEGLETGDIVLA